MRMKGYKAFSHGMICRKYRYNEKQYAEHTTYEEEGGEICGEGMMHFCANPLDCLEYYDLIDDDGRLVEIAEVEAEDPVTDDNKKYAAKKLHIGAKINIENLDTISIQVAQHEAMKNIKDVKVGSYTSQIDGLEENQIGGDRANQIGGYAANQIGRDCTNQIGGIRAKQIGRTQAKQIGKDYAKQIGEDYVKQIGDNFAAQIGEHCANQIGGICTKQIGGAKAKQIGSDYANQIGGANARQQAGENSILVAGANSRFKAGMNSVILCYWYDYDDNIEGFKVAQVDGINIKADTWYKLKDGEFVEEAESDVR